MSSAFSLGFSWFKDSCRTLKLQPLAYTGIVVFSLLMSGLLSSLPLIGTLLASLWMPFASVLTGFAARDVLAGRTPVYFTLIAIFRDKASRWPLLAVGEHLDGARHARLSDDGPGGSGSVENHG